MNLKEANKDYSDFSTHVFSRQFFLINNFNEAINVYFNDFEQVEFLKEGLLDGGGLDKNQFLLAVQVYYVESYKVLEDYYLSLSPSFKPLLLAVNSTETNHVANNEDVMPSKRDMKLNMITLSDSQISKLHSSLTTNGFINDMTPYLSFKHVMLQKDNGSKIYWIDTADNKTVNKVPILEFVNKIVNNTRHQNEFISKYFGTYINEKDDIISKESLANSRRIFKVKNSERNRRNDILDIINDILKI